MSEVPCWPARLAFERVEVPEMGQAMPALVWRAGWRMLAWVLTPRRAGHYLVSEN